MSLVVGPTMHINDLIHWALTHGIFMSCKPVPGENPLILKTTHAPFTLSSYSYPTEAFNKAHSLAPVFNTLVHKISLDSDWLLSVLKTTAHGDEQFTGRLVKIYETVLKEGIKQKVCLGINRSDYMLHSVPGDDRSLLQVEINTIASSFGSLSTKISEMYRRFEFSHSTDCPIPWNGALDGLSSGIALAHETYCRDRPNGDKANTVVVMVVQPKERNVADQRFLHYAIEEHGLHVVRATFQEIHDQGKLDAAGDLWLNGQRVSVVYYRAGYTPDDYVLSGTDAEWEARLTVERSTAIKCPNIAYHLAGTKKVQQELALPGMLERFVGSEDDVRLLRSVFAGLHSLDSADADPAVKARALRDPDSFVLKPQREGGGNNLYHKDLVEALQTLSEDELSSYILMERIQPPSQQSTLIRDCQPNETACLCELGIYGVHLNSAESIAEPVLNEYCGYLLRVKPSVADEGGVAAGYAVLSAPRLV